MINPLRIDPWFDIILHDFDVGLYNWNIADYDEAHEAADDDDDQRSYNPSGVSINCRVSSHFYI